MIDRSVDAIVIGGGPAGSAAAIHLAQLGYRIILVEKGPVARNKACGHCLNARALPLLERLGLLPAVRAIASGHTRHLHVHAPAQPPLTFLLGQSPISAKDSGLSASAGLTVSRAQLDQILRDRAAAVGVMVMHAATARLNSIGPSCIVDIRAAEQHVTAHAKLVIGADGVGSGVARAAGLAHRNTAGRAFGIAFDLPISAAPDLATHTIHMFVQAGGYMGAVHLGHDQLHCAALLKRCNAQQFLRELQLRFSELRNLGSAISDPPPTFAAVGPIPWRPNDIACPGVALVGDAAGYVEPFTGEGILWALKSAEILGEVAADLEIHAWSADHARRYQQRWEHTIARSQRLCRAVAYTINRPQLLGALMRTQRFHRPLVQRVIQRVSSCR